jgi:hypothetical protein
MSTVVKDSVFCASAIAACGLCFVGGMMCLGYTIARKPVSIWETTKLQLYMAKKGRNLTTIEVVYYCLFKRNA